MLIVEASDENSVPAGLGASVTSSGVHFRVWAPNRRTVEVVFEHQDRGPLLLTPDPHGYFSATCASARVGDLYRYRVDDTDAYPDPYSRFQPAGPHGPSMVIDPGRYSWGDAGWCGLDPARQVIYELHIGTFTEGGTYEAAAKRLPLLRDLGVTCIEIMPVNEFVGRFGWGYDGVNWFAPFHPYGEPDALRAFVDVAHQLGLGVILDVVYNHFGHEGNYLPQFASEYLTDRIKNPWGAAPNYACAAMCRLAIDNAAYWIREFHFDGLRLDAIQNIHDPAAPALLASLVRESREAAGARNIVVCAEDYLQRTPLIGGAGTGGAGIDQLWNDDFHHACRAALTGNHYGFFKNYRGTAQELLSSLKRGFLFQGQYDAWSQMNRGFAVKTEPLHSFVAFLQNHDAVANTLHGQRLQEIVSPGKYRALTAVLLLGPHTPLIFMGQEFAASTPFAYFADYPSANGGLWSGRKTEAEQFLQYRDPAALARILDPCAPDTVKKSTLQWSERDHNTASIRLHTDLIALRQRFHSVVTARQVDGALLASHAFVFRWFDELHGDRLLLVNLGPQMDTQVWAEPLMAAPHGHEWAQIWSSEAPQYGGMGTVDARVPTGWQLSADCACLLTAAPRRETSL